MSHITRIPTDTSLIPLDADKPFSLSYSEHSTKPRINSNALPRPTYLPPDPTKKSHARKQPLGHVPRPRNAFILFRCDFVRQKKVPQDVENDHKNISRIAGSVWREMTDADKAPWVEMAEKEKALHTKTHPGYRYNPNTGTFLASKKKKRGNVTQADCIPPLHPVDVGVDIVPQNRLHAGHNFAHDERTNVPDVLVNHIGTDRYVLPWETFEDDISVAPVKPSTMTNQATVSDFLDLRRTSSCPPGAQRISSCATIQDDTITAPLRVRDDLTRRPSCVTMYQSSANLSSTIDHPSFHTLGKDNRPILEIGPYIIDPPGDAPGWDCAASIPWRWTVWDILHQNGNIPGFDNFIQNMSIHDPNSSTYNQIYDLTTLPPLPRRSPSPAFTDPFLPGFITPAVPTLSPPTSPHTAPPTEHISSNVSANFEGASTATFVGSGHVPERTNFDQPVTHDFAAMALPNESLLDALISEAREYFDGHSNSIEDNPYWKSMIAPPTNDGARIHPQKTEGGACSTSERK